jgi:hypothetical protein
MIPIPYITTIKKYFFRLITFFYQFLLILYEDIFEEKINLISSSPRKILILILTSLRFYLIHLSCGLHTKAVVKDNLLSSYLTEAHLSCGQFRPQFELVPVKFKLTYTTGASVQYT